MAFVKGAGALLVLALVCACGSASGQKAAPDVAEHLVFTGEVHGVLSAGTDTLVPGTRNPTSAAAPAHTECDVFTVDGVGKDFVAVILGTVSGHKLALTVEVNTAQRAYVTPGARLEPGDINTGGSTTLRMVTEADDRSSVAGPAGQQPAIITLGQDRRSGTIDAWFAAAGMSQKLSPAHTHVVGTWRCG